MRARWVILIVGGAVAIACTVLLLHPDSGKVSAHVLGRTNDCYTVLITNGTRQHSVFAAWSEVQEHGEWSREQAGKRLVFLPLAAYRPATADVSFLTTNSPRRIAVLYVQIDDSQFAHWMGAARALMGFQRNPVQKLYIDAP